MPARSSRRLLLAFACSFAFSAPAFAQLPPVQLATWHWVQPSQGAAELRDVAFADSARGFAVGAAGTIVRTKDGGKTWEGRPSPTSANLVAAAASGTTFVAAGGTSLARSTDSGDTFAQLITLPCAAADLVFLGAGHGFGVCSDGGSFATTDAFQTVRATGRITFGQPQAVWFTSTATGLLGWAVGSANNGADGFIARTTDGGSSWTLVQQTPGAGGFTSVSGVGTNVVVGGMGTPDVSFSTDGQGLRFSAGAVGGGGITSVAARSSSFGGEVWFAASDGLWGLQTNAGTPQQSSSLSHPRLFAVASPAQGLAVAVGEGGTIVRASLGQQAIVVSGGLSASFTAASFPTADGQTGVLIDNQASAPRAWTTTSGGTSLTPQQLAPAPIADAQFVDASTGFGLLTNGDFYATTSGAGGFRPIARLTINPTRLAFADATHGYAGGAGLLRTADGGGTWRTAIDVNQLGGGTITGVAVSGGGAAAVTSNAQVWVRAGGFDAPWQRLPQTVNGTLQTVAISPNGLVIAGGVGPNGGGVLETVNLASGARTGVTTSSSVLSVTTVGERLFTLMKGGTLSEVNASGVAVSTFESHAQLYALASRAVNGVVAPAAVGDFGSILLFDDQSQPPPPRNQPPTVSVTPTTLTLPVNAPGSIGGPLVATATDPEGAAITYSWSDLTKSGLKFTSPTDATTGVVWALPVPAGATAIARVTACDPLGACATADVQIIADGSSGTNHPPVAAASGAAANAGDLAILDGSASSDPDGDLLTFQWKQVSGAPVTVQGPSDQPTLLVDAPNTVGTSAFQLTVCDPGGLCSTVEVVLVVSLPGQDSAPVPVVPADMVVPSGATITLDASGSEDPEGDPIASFQWREANGRLSVANATSAVATAVAGRAGDTYRFVVRVCDPSNQCAEAGVNVKVIAGAQNQPPQVTATPAKITPNPGETVLLSATATDPEGGPVTMKWIDLQPAQGLSLTNLGPGLASFVAPAGPANLRFQVEACDAQGACASAFVDVIVGVAFPVANAGADLQAVAGDTVTLDGSASTNAASYSWVQTSGAPVQLTGADTARPSFVAPRTPGDLTFRLDVTSADGHVASDSVTVVVSAPRGPVADAGRDLTVGFGARVQLDGRHSSDGQGRPLTFHWEAPADVQLTGADGPLALFIAPAQAATLRFVLTVCAAPDVCDSAQVTITVAEGANLPPLPNAGLDRTANAGDVVALDGTSSRDPEGETLTAKWTQRDGAGAKIGADDSLWTTVKLPQVTQTTQLVFDLQVCDPKGACGVDSVQVTVLPRSDVTPTLSLSIVDHADGKVPEDTDFEVKVDVTCPAAACLAPDVLVLSGPPLARLSGDGVRFHAPVLSRSLPFLLQVTVCDQLNHCAAASLDGLVDDSVNEPPVAVTRGAQTVRRRQNVVLDGSGSYDPNGEPLLYRWTQATGPAEVELVGGDGPRAHFTAPMIPGTDPTGLYRFRLEVCDPRGLCDRAAAEVTVEGGDPVNRAPVADAGPDKTAPIGSEIVLNGSGSYDPDGDGISYHWTLSDAAPATLTDEFDAHAKLVVTAPTADPIHVQLEVCDAFEGCGTAVVTVTPYALPTDDSQGKASLGQATQACGCAGGGAEALGLLPLAGALLVRRRRRA